MRFPGLPRVSRYLWAWKSKEFFGVVKGEFAGFVIFGFALSVFRVLV